MAPQDAKTHAFLRPGPYAVRHGFLGAAANAELLDYVLANADKFEPSTVFDAQGKPVVDPSYRISSKMWPSKRISGLVRDRTREALDDVAAELGIKPFEPSTYEIEIAAHGDGAFFTRHIDTKVGVPEDQDAAFRGARAISIVYYFCQTPPRFSGGELRVHAIAGTGEPGSFADIRPENDLAVFFPSWMPHEVLKVHCPDKRFESSRFAVNCWVYE